MKNELLTFIEKKYSGECLSDTYTHQKAVYIWRCKNQHVFKAKYCDVIKGKWCVKCSGLEHSNMLYKKLRLSTIQKGGSIIGKEIINEKSLIKIKCRKGHIFGSSVFDFINDISSCDKCNLEPKDWNITQAKFFAYRKKGKCLSHKIKNENQLLQWKCSENHYFELSSKLVQKGIWCTECLQIDLSKGLRKHSIREINQYAQTKEGKLLSKEFINSRNILVWQCKKGHHFKRTLKEVLNDKWCETCNEN